MTSPHCPVLSSLFLLSILFIHFPSETAADFPGEASALLAFRSAVGPLQLPWNSSVSPCEWLGVECTGDRVTFLHLPASGLSGQIPVGTLGNLSELETLSLRFNALSSPLPPDLSRCTKLRFLSLDHNNFTGDIPSFIASLTALVRLNLANNRFSGAILPALNNLTRLHTLYLQNNQLAGEIPELDLPVLVYFNVSFNRLNGSVPSKLRGMPPEAFLGTQLCGGSLGVCRGETGKRNLPGGVIAAIAVASIIFAVFIFVGVLILLFRRQKSGDHRQEGMKGGAYSNAKPAMASATVAPVALGSQNNLVFFGYGSRAYDLVDLLRASAEVLGKGTFGTAYKVVMESGLAVAVKRLRYVNMPQDDFRAKIEGIGAMDHPNIVPLRGYYLGKDEVLLVYDYIPMGSLSSFLHGGGGSSRSPLNWETRASIALRAARGIEYIHSTGPSAAHGNINSSNILLASASDIRVADHSLSRLVSGVTAISKPVSQKGDVYSFGVVLLELLTGKTPALSEGVADLPGWVRSIAREEWMTEVLDMELLRYQSEEEEMLQMLQIGVDCTAQTPDQRPAMAAVVARIEEIHPSGERASS